MHKILVVDDNQDMVETLERLLSFYQFGVITALNGKEAVDRAVEEQPDIVILDAHMPVMDGFTACKKLKSMRRTEEIPVVILTAKYVDAESRASGLEIGADDYLLKPFNSKELVNRIKTLLKKSQVMKALKRENEELAKKQKQMFRDLDQARKTDPTHAENLAIDHLTGLYSKQYFWSRLREEYNRALRYKHGISLILIDIDTFRRFNEIYSHQIGDYVLMKMANIILNNTRVSDIVARLDGAYFAVILPQTNVQGGFFEAERLRVSLNQNNYVDEFLIGKRRRRNEIKHVTASLGVATHPDESDISSEKELFDRAKKALDRAKAGGKNKTFSFSNEV
jgi:diguanylate cyclase (GGDEF)-like protein